MGYRVRNIYGHSYSVKQYVTMINRMNAAG